MLGKKISRYFLIPIVSLSLAASPIDFSFFLNISSAEDVVPNEDISGVVNWSGIKSVSGIVTVKSGSTLTITKGTIVEFDGATTVEIYGNLSVQGTPEQPVIFRKKDGDEMDQYSVSAVSGGKISVRNADVSGGGIAFETFLIGERSSFFQYADAFWVYNGAFGAKNGGTLDIEGVNFHGNPLAVYTDSKSYSKTKVWRSKFLDNGFDFVSGYTYGSGKSDVRYNWWGSNNGPMLSFSEQENLRMYEKIVGNVSVSPWADAPDTKDPVIVVPGAMGSWKMTNESALELDPIFGTYDNLLETLGKNGYEEGKNLFQFPYEWRMSNVETAKLLKAKVEEAKAVAEWPRVDIVAHSMGGLVAREYIEKLGGDGSVDQLITLGTPHNGAPKSYLMWEGGAFRTASKFSITDFFAEKIFQQEAKENGYDTIFDYIRQVPIQSVRELLPIYPYLRVVNESDLMLYPSTSYPRNTFLESLKTSTALAKLSPVLFTNIVGKTASDETIEKIRVNGLSIELLNDLEKAVLWGHGKPDGYDDFFGGDRGLELGSGDGTVPIDSAKGIASDELIELLSSHGDLPSDATDIVYKTLVGMTAQSSSVKESQPASLFLVMPFSPVDIQVVFEKDGQRKRIGKNFDGDGFLNEIPGAYYTGSDTKNEFVTIPNPEDGKYTILARGTDDGGSYRIEATKITEGEDGDTTESTATIEGEAIAGVAEEYASVEVSGNVVELVQDKDVVAPTVMITSPESKTYVNNGIALVSYDASDDVSSGEELAVAVSLDGIAYEKSDIDLSLLPLGTHTIKVTATDEAGNTGEAQADFTLATFWDALIANIDHYATLKLLKNKGETKMLKQQLSHLRQTAEILEKYDIFFRLHPKVRDIFEREIDRHLSTLQKYVERRSGKSIDPSAADRLIESMESLKKSM